MTARYYFKKLATAFICLVAVYLEWEKSPQSLKMQYLLLYSIFSCPLYPYTLYALEKIALKFTTKQFWHTGFFNDDVGKNGIVAIYCVFCFIFSIPLLIILLPFFIKKVR